MQHLTTAQAQINFNKALAAYAQTGAPHRALRVANAHAAWLAAVQAQLPNLIAAFGRLPTANSQRQAANGHWPIKP